MYYEYTALPTNITMVEYNKILYDITNGIKNTNIIEDVCCVESISDIEDIATAKELKLIKITLLEESEYKLRLKIKRLKEKARSIRHRIS